MLPSEKCILCEFYTQENCMEQYLHFFCLLSMECCFLFNNFLSKFSKIERRTDGTTKYGLKLFNYLATWIWSLIPKELKKVFPELTVKQWACSKIAYSFCKIFSKS